MALLARQLYFEAIKVGDELPPLVKPPVDRTQIARYAGASGDFNPLYVDEHLARNAGFPSALAPGMLVMGFLGELVVDWLRGARLRRYGARFVKIVWPGDVITCRGRVVDRRFEGNGVYAVDLEVSAENQRGELVLKGLVTSQLYYNGEDDARQRAGQPPLVITPEEEAARLAKLSRAQGAKRPEASRPPPAPPPRPAPAKPAAAPARPGASAPAPDTRAPKSLSVKSPSGAPAAKAPVAAPPPPLARPKAAAPPAKPVAAPAPVTAPRPPQKPAPMAAPVARPAPKPVGSPAARPVAPAPASKPPTAKAGAAKSPPAKSPPRTPPVPKTKPAAGRPRPGADRRGRPAKRATAGAARIKPAARGSRPAPRTKPTGKKRR